MPKKPAHDPTYGYDPETHTVLVDQHPARSVFAATSIGPTRVLKLAPP
jgi:hypothetical protein